MSADAGKGLGPRYGALQLMFIADSVAAALERAGLTDCDDPGNAIDVLREDLEARVAFLDSERRRLSAPAVVSGEWVLVRREPSDAMKAAGFESGAWDELSTAVIESGGKWPYSCRESADCVTGIFGAMVDAAPQPPAESLDQRYPATNRREQAVSLLLADGWTWDGAAWVRPPAEAQYARMAIKLMVAAGYVTEAKANEALNIAHGFDKGPLAPPSAPVGVEAVGDAIDRLEYYLSNYDADCDCESEDARCGQCGKAPKDCTGTACAATCQCSECDHCLTVAVIEALAQQPAAVDGGA